MARTDSPFAARQRARRRALQALYQWQMTEQGANEILEQFLVEQDLSKVDVPYFEGIVRDVIRDRADLDALLSPYLDRPLEQVDPLERAVLRIAALELKARLDVPARVAINEALDLAHTFGATESHQFVNAVVDRVARHSRAGEFDGG